MCNLLTFYTSKAKEKPDESGLIVHGSSGLPSPANIWSMAGINLLEWSLQPTVRW
ncbi:hypothetical protein OE983_000984 [Escherichia coli]|nr:hypothetical protein [Escherichia coli]